MLSPARNDFSFGSWPKSRKTANPVRKVTLDKKEQTAKDALIGFYVKPDRYKDGKALAFHHRKRGFPSQNVFQVSIISPPFQASLFYLDHEINSATDFRI